MADTGMTTPWSAALASLLGGSMPPGAVDPTTGLPLATGSNGIGKGGPAPAALSNSNLPDNGRGLPATVLPAAAQLASGNNIVTPPIYQASGGSVDYNGMTWGHPQDRLLRYSPQTGALTPNAPTAVDANGRVTSDNSNSPQPFYGGGSKVAPVYSGAPRPAVNTGGGGSGTTGGGTTGGGDSGTTGGGTGTTTPPPQEAPPTNANGDGPWPVPQGAVPIGNGQYAVTQQNPEGGSVFFYFDSTTGNNSNTPPAKAGSKSVSSLVNANLYAQPAPAPVAAPATTAPATTTSSGAKATTKSVPLPVGGNQPPVTTAPGTNVGAGSGGTAQPGGGGTPPSGIRLGGNVGVGVGGGGGGVIGGGGSGVAPPTYAPGQGITPGTRNPGFGAMPEANPNWQHSNGVQYAEATPEQYNDLINARAQQGDPAQYTNTQLASWWNGAQSDAYRMAMVGNPDVANRLQSMGLVTPQQINYLRAGNGVDGYPVGLITWANGMAMTNFKPDGSTDGKTHYVIR